MLSKNLIEYLKSKNFWFDEISPNYLTSLQMLNVACETDFGNFYLHADDGPSFISKNGEIHQICWHILNSNFLENSKSLILSLNLPDSLIPLDKYEGGSGYFYDISNKNVMLISNTNSGTFIENQWEEFSLFLEYFFEIN